jgi:L-threonylcarbamoyladenylate synthase
LNAWHLGQAARIVRAGGVIAYPTEAVYGLGCLPDDPVAVARLLALKGRRTGKGLIVVASRLEDLEPLVDWSGIDQGRVLETWPGPVTWALPAGAGASSWIRGPGGRVAVRVSAHPLVRALCDRTGPLVSTSANPSGRPPARSSLAVRRYFGRRLDYLLPGELGGRASPTEIRDAGTGAVLRKGG